MPTLVVSSFNQVNQFNGQPKKVIALGDSLVYGFGDPEGGGWVERLRRHWMMPNSHGHVLYNLGVRGDRVSQVAQRLESEFRYRGELRNRVPDAIILSVGVNDSAKVGRPNGRNHTDFASFQVEIANLLDRALSLCPVFFVGMVPVDEAKMPFLGCMYFNLTEQYRYKEATRLACQQRQIPYLDIFERWMQKDDEWRRSRISEDGLHPNGLGYQSLLQDVTSWENMANLSAQISARS